MQYLINQNYINIKFMFQSTVIKIYKLVLN